MRQRVAIIGSGPSAIEIAGNVILNHRGSGIFVANDTRDVTISSNLLSGNGRGGISVVRSACIDISDNIIVANAQVGIIGSGRAEADLRGDIERLGLTGRAHLLGFREDGLKYVRAFDIWTMPSLAEGLGLALLEGMSGHLPVIASNVAGRTS